MTFHLSISSLSWQTKKKKSINSLTSFPPSGVTCPLACMPGSLRRGHDVIKQRRDIKICVIHFISAPQLSSTRQPRLLSDQRAGRAGAGVASGRCHGHAVKHARGTARSGNTNRKLTRSWENKALLGGQTLRRWTVNFMNEHKAAGSVWKHNEPFLLFSFEVWLLLLYCL